MTILPEALKAPLAHFDNHQQITAAESETTLSVYIPTPMETANSTPPLDPSSASVPTDDDDYQAGTVMWYTQLSGIHINAADPTASEWKP